MATGEVRLLVAEDNEINQDLIHRQLTQLGYVADIVGDGRQALEQLPRGNYALLLTDCHMPEMDGYALARAVREVESASGSGFRLPIIAFTANILVSDVQRCHDAGMDDVVGKPTVLEDLGRALARWVKAVPEPLAAKTGAVATSVVAPSAPLAETPHESAAAGTVRFERLNDLIGPNPAAHARILTKFIGSARTLLDEIGAAAQQGDAAALGALGHKFEVFGPRHRRRCPGRCLRCAGGGWQGRRCRRLWRSMPQR